MDAQQKERERKVHKGNPVEGSKLVAADQVTNDRYALYNGDSCQVLPTLPSETIGFCLHSPPFFSMYTYSDDPADLSNCKDYAEFMDHYGFIIRELNRLLMPGRVVAVHCMDMPTYKRNGEDIGIKDFPGDIIRRFESEGFIYHSRFTIWKDPLVAATRTKAIGLAHKQIVKDSAMCRTGLADYILAFRKKGENPVPITHKKGLTQYYGSNNVPGSLMENNEQGKNKRSHYIWQRYASPVWMDIRQTRVLQYQGGREEEDGKHICPLQLDVIERCMELWSTEGDNVLTPFMGIGSEVYVAVKNGRRGIGVELKRSYFKMAARNMRVLEKKAKGLS